jgi:hypothetical protein
LRCASSTERPNSTLHPGHLASALLRSSCFPGSGSSRRRAADSAANSGCGP